MTEELTCAKAGCGVAFDYSGTGRRPKYCPTHREKPRPDRVTPASRKASTKGLEHLRTELLQTLQGGGAMLMAVDKFDGAVVIAGAPKLVDALISMAEVNPAFRKFLESSAASVVWLQLGTAVAAIAVPIAAHHRLVPLDAKAAYQLFHGPAPDFVATPPPAPAPVEVEVEPAVEPIVEAVA